MAEALATKAKSEAGRVKQVVIDNITKVTDPLIVKLTGGGELNKEEDEFILPFAAADGAGKDRLYRRLGVPGLADGKSVKLNLFGRLVWAFEDKVWEDKAKDDVERAQRGVDASEPGEEKQKSQEVLEFYQKQAKSNARATAHNAWGKFKEENT